MKKLLSKSIYGLILFIMILFAILNFVSDFVLECCMYIEERINDWSEN